MGGKWIAIALLLPALPGCTGLPHEPASVPASAPAAPAGLSAPAAAQAPAPKAPAPAQKVANAKAPSSPAKSPIAKVPAPAATPKAAPAPSAPPLDLAALEQQLKDTKAIGVMTKLSLKNQVDDLLGKFRAYYAGQLRVTLAELRQPYDLLLMKVLSLLQDSDPPLARSIVASREAIWGILADPAKFSKI